MTTTMISVSFSLKSSPSSPSLFLRCPQRSSILKKKLNKIGSQELSSRIRRGKYVCKSELVQDAPFAAAIGACVLTSLISPISYDDEDSDGGGAIDSTDARFAVMGIISLIPYFNWMSWVFAWLDSGKQRYLIYAVVYLAPYLRTNLSLSPDESWLPIASIVICILHIQLEASLKIGDIDGIQFFGRVLKLFSPSTEKDDAKLESHQEIPKKGRNKKKMDLPSARRNMIDEVGSGEWETPRKHVGDPHHLKEHLDGDEKASERD